MANDKTLREFKLSNLIQEIVTIALYEQTLVEQDPQMQPPQQNAGPVPPPAPAPPPEQTQQAPQGQTAQPLTVDTMIEKLNVIRGGKSFTDPEIYGQFTTFFKTLGPEQLQTIDQFLQDVSKIVVSVDQSSQQQGTDTGMPPQQAPANNAGAQPPIGASQAATPPSSAGGGMPGV